jgi:hypothetical protein
MSSARRLLAATVLVATLGTTITGGVVFWHWSHSTVFYPVHTSGPEMFAKVKVDEPQTAGMSFPHNRYRRTRTVHVIAAVPHVVHNTAGATFRVDVCTLDPAPESAASCCKARRRPPPFAEASPRRRVPTCT